MDSLAIVILLVLLVLASYQILPRRKRKLPPGPFVFPIIGNILQLGSNLHRSLAKLSQSYGPLMSLQLGPLLTVVVSSPAIAKQVLQQHDEAFCNRTPSVAAEARDLRNHSMGLLPVESSKWKKERKICREHLFSTHRLDESQGLRLEKLTELRDYVEESCRGARVVDVGEAAFVTSLNLMTATLFSAEVAKFGSDESQGLKETVEGVQRFLGAPNVADFFPVLKAMDPQGIKKRAGFYIGKLFDMFEDMISQRLQSRETSDIDPPKKYYDLLEILLDLRVESDYNLNINDMKYLFMDLLIGGTHTTTSIVEWAMTELLLNPVKMENAKNELRTVIGKYKQVEESDICRLPYLQAVLAETFRLHPPAPFLVPRKADYEVEINGYIIPKNAQIFVNVWAIGRNSNVWENPNSFQPERFFNKKGDFRGQDFALLPFGSGRRICPGLALADRMLPLMVASLINGFDWEFEAGVKPEDVDTADKFGVAVRKAIPLIAIPTKA